MAGSRKCRPHPSMEAIRRTPTTPTPPWLPPPGTHPGRIPLRGAAVPTPPLLARRPRSASTKHRAHARFHENRRVHSRPRWHVAHIASLPSPPSQFDAPARQEGVRRTRPVRQLSSGLLWHRWQRRLATPPPASSYNYHRGPLRTRYPRWPRTPNANAPGPRTSPRYGLQQPFQVSCGHASRPDPALGERRLPSGHGSCRQQSHPLPTILAERDYARPCTI